MGHHGGQIFGVGATLTNTAEHDIGGVFTRQFTGVLRVAPIDDEDQPRGRPASQLQGGQMRLVDRGRHLAVMEILQCSTALAGGDAIGPADAGAAAI